MYNSREFRFCQKNTSASTFEIFTLITGSSLLPIYGDIISFNLGPFSFFLERLYISQIKTGKLKDGEKQNLKTGIDQLIIKMICRQIMREKVFEKQTKQSPGLFTK